MGVEEFINNENRKRFKSLRLKPNQGVDTVAETIKPRFVSLKCKTLL
jgi:hypothetical protein